MKRGYFVHNDSKSGRKTGSSPLLEKYLHFREKTAILVALKLERFPKPVPDGGFCDPFAPRGGDGRLWI
jgi:hypothetical protein